MSTWEERMAQRHQQRHPPIEYPPHARVVAYLEDGTEQGGYMNHHPGHPVHVPHLHGTGVICSCRADFGVTTVAFPEDWVQPEWCVFCGRRFGDDSDLHPATDRSAWVGGTGLSAEDVEDLEFL